MYTSNYLKGLVLNTNGYSTSSRYFLALGKCHDIAIIYSNNTLNLIGLILTSQSGQISVITLWLTRLLFQVGWEGNFEFWAINPKGVAGSSSSVWDLNSFMSKSDSCSTSIYLELYNILLTLGFKCNEEIIRYVSSLEALSVHLLILSYTSAVLPVKNLSWHTTDDIYTLVKSNVAWLRLVNTSYFKRVYISGASLSGISSIAWSGHLAHCAAPSSRGFESIIRAGLKGNKYYINDSSNHIFGSKLGSGTTLLTFISGLSPNTGSVYLTDLAHHHLSIGLLLAWGSSLYISASKSNKILCHMTSNYNLQLSLGLIGLSINVYIVSKLVLSIPAFVYLYIDWASLCICYMHHSWVASILPLGSGAHIAIFYVRDIENCRSSLKCIMFRTLFHKSTIVAHISWSSQLLGFHGLALYIHNDVQSALKCQNSQIILDLNLEFPKANPKLPSKLVSVSCTLLTDKPTRKIGTTLLSPDIIVAHSVSLGVHVVSLIIIKGSFDGPGSKLYPDKLEFSYSFPCDGPGRRGTCDISPWDSLYLASFWMLNTNSQLDFGFHFKSLFISTSIRIDTSDPFHGPIKIINYRESSQTLNGWFRDYLQFNSRALVKGYDVNKSNDLSVCG